jgi:hypothetical protein
VGEQVVSITLAYVPLDLILPDQPNRAVRTRMLRGVGGAPCEGVSLSRWVVPLKTVAVCYNQNSCSSDCHWL